VPAGAQRTREFQRRGLRRGVERDRRSIFSVESRPRYIEIHRVQHDGIRGGTRLYVDRHAAVEPSAAASGSTLIS